eukprot:9005270-Heterocapsa_arctica.AAC.1
MPHPVPGAAQYPWGAGRSRGDGPRCARRAWSPSHPRWAFPTASAPRSCPCCREGERSPQWEWSPP